MWILDLGKINTNYMRQRKRSELAISPDICVIWSAANEICAICSSIVTLLDSVGADNLGCWKILGLPSTDGAFTGSFHKLSKG